MITLARLKEVLSYDSLTGLFTWRVALSSRAHVGQVAGGLNSDGYVQIGIDGGRYYGHRLAWFYVHGYYPDKTDHRDLNRSNNRIDNLRDASPSENGQNVVTARNSSKTGLLGSSLHGASGLYRATITVDRKQTCIGYFSTAEAAHAAYVREKRRLHPMGTL